MLRIRITAVGRMKQSPLLDLWNEYTRRLQWTFVLDEIEAKNSSDEEKKIEAKIDRQAFLFVLDERGKNLTSRLFSDKLGGLAAEGRPSVQFVIGGADGLPDSIRERANTLMSFGSQTWPHMLARVMLAEQLYRAQQILLGHPYHRD